MAQDPLFFPPLNQPHNKQPGSLRCERGQGLIEYLIIVSLIAVGTIGIMRVMGQAVGSRLATISDALQGERKTHAVDKIDENLLKKKDLGNFMNGVGTNDGGSN